MPRIFSSFLGGGSGSLPILTPNSVVVTDGSGTITTNSVLPVTLGGTGRTDRTLYDATFASKSVDWNNGELWRNGVLRYDWFDALTYNSSGLKIFDTQYGYVYNGTNDTIMAYLSTGTLYSTYGSGTSVDWDNCYLKNPTDTQLAIDWYQRIGVDPSGTVVFSWTSTTEFVLTRDLSFASSGGNIRSDTTVGVKFGTAASELISFWGATPIIQPDTSIAAATFSSVGGAAVHHDDTFDGYTIGQIVTAMRTSGLLA